MYVYLGFCIDKSRPAVWTGEERHVTFIFLRLRNVKLMCIVHAQKILSFFFRKHAFVSFCKTFQVNQQL